MIATDGTTQTARSARTKAAILDAAREHFALYGYERATIRDIAARASIHPSMVMRYYGSKRQLFAAANDFDLRAPDLADVPLQERGRAIVEHFLSLWDDETIRTSLTVLLVNAATDQVAAEHVQKILSQHLHHTVATSVTDPHDLETRVGLVTTQLFGLALTRYIVRVPQVAALDPSTLVATVGPAIQHYLTAPIPD